MWGKVIEMKNVSFNSGVLCVGSPDGEFSPIGEVKEMDLDEVVNVEDAIPDLRVSSEANISITLTQEQVDAFIETLVRVREHALDLVRAQGYTRIAHLARHARNHRTRKKNLFRAYRILRKEWQS